MYYDAYILAKHIYLMGTKLKVKNQIIELPRGAAAPNEGDVVYITLRGEKTEKLYTVDLIEHEYNFNMSLPIGTRTITLTEVKSKKNNEAKPTLPKSED